MHIVSAGDGVMETIISDSLNNLVKKLKTYLEKGQKALSIERVAEEKDIFLPFEPDCLKPLKKMDAYNAEFFAVDCSTRTLKRAHNWGIYIFRAAYAAVKNREVKWGHKENLEVIFGNFRTRQQLVREIRMELESILALSQLNTLERGDYLFLDGASYFGKKKGFRVALYEKCREKGIILLAVSKQSPILRDERGRDFQAMLLDKAKYPLWVYYPVLKAHTKEHLYGDVSVAKLCEGSPRTFRIDIMGYLTENDVAELLAPLTAITQDPRCVGYPVALWLAHDFSKIAEEKLLYYYDLIEKTLSETGLREELHREELSCSFADELHGLKYPFQTEWVEYV